MPRAHARPSTRANVTASTLNSITTERSGSPRHMRHGASRQPPSPQGCVLMSTRPASGPWQPGPAGQRANHWTIVKWTPTPLTPDTKKPRPLAWAFAPPLGLEPRTLRIIGSSRFESTSVDLAGILQSFMPSIDVNWSRSTRNIALKSPLVRQVGTLRVRPAVADDVIGAAQRGQPAMSELHPVHRGHPLKFGPEVTSDARRLTKAIDRRRRRLTSCLLRPRQSTYSASTLFLRRPKKASVPAQRDPSRSR